jgi:hypothetical protein
MFRDGRIFRGNFRIAEPAGHPAPGRVAGGASETPGTGAQRPEPAGHGPARCAAGPPQPRWHRNAPRGVSARRYRIHPALGPSHRTPHTRDRAHIRRTGLAPDPYHSVSVTACVAAGAGLCGRLVRRARSPPSRSVAAGTGKAALSFALHTALASYLTCYVLTTQDNFHNIVSSAASGFDLGIRWSRGVVRGAARGTAAGPVAETKNYTNTQQARGEPRRGWSDISNSLRGDRRLTGVLPAAGERIRGTG